MSISKKIAKLRKELKLTNEEFGEKIGVTGRMVARWENNTSKPNSDQINKIKEVYGIDLLEISEKRNTVKKVNISKEPNKNVVYSLDSRDAKGLKFLCKFISVVAKIVKVLLIIAIPFLISAMIIVPVIINHIEIGDNYITYKNNGENILTIEGEDVFLSGKYTIRHRGKVTTGEIKYDLLGEMVKNIKNMNNTKIIVCAETLIVLSIASVIFEIVFLTYLANLFRNLCEKTPFTEDNVNYLKKMTNIYIANLIVIILMQFLMNLFTNVDFSKNNSFSSIVIMLILASLTYIFKYGCNLQKNVNADIY